jgi:chromosome segregation ATPase
VATVGSLIVDLKGNTATFSADMGKARTILQKSVSGMAGDIASLQGAFSSLLKGFGVGISIAGIVSFTKSLMDAASETIALSKQLHLTTDEMQALDNSARGSGASVDTMHEALNKLNTSIGEATGGNREMQKAFVDLGVSFDDVHGKALNTDTVIQAIADGYGNASDKTQYLADASKVLGRNVSELNGVLADLANKGMQGVIDQQKSMGQIVSAESLDAWRQFGDTLQNVWSGIKAAAEDAGAAMLYASGIAEKSELGKVADQIKEIQDKLAAGGTYMPRIGRVAPFSADEIADLNKQLAELQKRQAELQAGPVAPGASGARPGDYRITPGTAIAGTAAAARPPHIDIKPGELSAVEQLTADLTEQAKEAGIATTNINAHTMALAKMQAQHKLDLAIMQDVKNGTRTNTQATDDERKAVDKLVESQVNAEIAAKKLGSQGAVAELIKGMEEQAKEAGVAALNINDQARALAHLQAQAKLTQAALQEFKEGRRGSADATAAERAEVDKLVDSQQDQEVAAKNIAAAQQAQIDVQEKLAEQAKATAEAQAQSLADITQGLKDIGAGFTAAMSGQEKWKDFATNAINTVFNLIYDQFTKLKAFGGSGGSIFENLIGGFMSSLTGIKGPTSAPGGGKGSFAGGGSFVVGGQGATDSRLVQFMATPGEEVSVTHGHGQGGGEGGDGPSVNVQVINNTGQQATAQQSKGADGSKIVKVMVGDALSRDIRQRGPASQMLEATYGLNRRGG